MSQVGFFNQPKPKGFHHIPIYFDPEKEALEERIQRKKEELGLETEEEKVRPHLRKGFIIESSTFVRRYQEKRGKAPNASMLNIKGIVALVLLLIAFYYFYLR